MRKILLLLLLTTACAACSFGSRAGRDDPARTLAAVRAAHDAYVESINTNKAERWLAAVDEDAVFFVPNQQAIVGKDAVGVWITRYLQEVRTHWNKSVQDFVVSGEWAFGRYEYTAADSVVIHDPETEGGGTANDSGWGLVVYHRGGDGQWRVARDAWGSDRPAR
ncbi:MAG TPA: nuclear transport factor 2 family protein [Vicinamibacterales bacterium]|nr:nuclear transport factor 2 family protein [Vicinamibacterales bacterium]